MLDYLDNFWSIYSNLVLSLGTASLLALSIYLTLSCGMLAMANAAFMGIGAYTSAILTMNYNAPFSVAIGRHGGAGGRRVRDRQADAALVGRLPRDGDARVRRGRAHRDPEHGQPHRRRAGP